MDSLQDKDITQLKALLEFLKSSFPGTSVNGLKIDDAALSLEGAIEKLESLSYVKEAIDSSLNGSLLDDCGNRNDDGLYGYPDHSRIKSVLSDALSILNGEDD